MDYKKHSLQLNFKYDSKDYSMKFFKQQKKIYFDILVTSDKFFYSANSVEIYWTCCSDLKNHKNHSMRLKKMYKRIKKFWSIQNTDNKIQFVFGKKHYKFLIPI